MRVECVVWWMPEARQLQTRVETERVRDGRVALNCMVVRRCRRDILETLAAAPCATQRGSLASVTPVAVSWLGDASANLGRMHQHETRQHHFRACKSIVYV